MFNLHLPFILLAVFSLPSQATLLNETLSFDSNSVPFGWSFHDTSEGQHNVGIGNGRFYANQVDSSGYLERMYMPDPNATSLKITWEGNIFQTYWGNFQGVELKNSVNDAWYVGAESKNYNMGSGIRFFTSTTVNQPYFSPSGGYNFQQGNFTSGSYIFTTTFTDGLISFSGVLNGNSIFSFDTVVPDFKLSNQRSIDFFVAETTGPTQWIDNISLQETRSIPVPEPGIFSMVLYGICLLGAVIYHSKYNSVNLKQLAS